MYATPCISCGVGRPYKKRRRKKTHENKARKRVGKVEIEKKTLKIGIDLMTYAFSKVAALSTTSLLPLQII
jgi:hypothetical protein